MLSGTHNPPFRPPSPVSPGRLHRGTTYRNQAQETAEPPVGGEGVQPSTKYTDFPGLHREGICGDTSTQEPLLGAPSAPALAPRPRTPTSLLKAPRSTNLPGEALRLLLGKPNPCALKVATTPTTISSPLCTFPESKSLRPEAGPETPPRLPLTANKSPTPRAVPWEQLWNSRSPSGSRRTF